MLFKLLDKKRNILVCSSYDKKTFLQVATIAMQETKGSVYSKDGIKYYLVY